jgi:hypothetical protein
MNVTCTRIITDGWFRISLTRCPILQESYNELRNKDAIAMLVDMKRRLAAGEDVNAPLNDQV